MPEIKVRVGELEVDEPLPGISALAEAAREAGFKPGSNGLRYAEEVEEGENYLYLYYTQDVTEERRQFLIEDEEEEVDEEIDEDQADIRLSNQNFARSMRFLLRDDGYYAFQSTTGVSGEHAIEYVLEEFDISQFECERRENFPPDWMSSFYSSAHSIRKVKLKNIGDREEETDEVDDSVFELVEGAGEPTVLSTFSTSGRDNNLRTSTIIDAFVRLSDIKFVSARTIEDEIEKLNRTGRLTIRYPADLDHEGQASRMYEATEKILRNI